MHVAENFDRARVIIELALNEHAHISYSQFGEDLLIDIFFHGRQTPGFYVDVGAHHPQRLSNTHLLHQRGWRGINVDGDPELIERFKLARPSDTNITAFVSEKAETVTFNRFSDTAVNTISSEKATHYATNWKIVSQAQVTTRTLKELLDEYLPQGQEIDVLSVDVEGVDLKVLKGNNWSKYRPRLVIVEAEDLNLLNAAAHPTVTFMTAQGYKLAGYLHVTAFFWRV